MIFQTKIKPTFYIGATREDILDKIKQGYNPIVSVYASLALKPCPYLVNKDHIRVYNIEKRRKKVNRFSKNGKSHSTVINGNHWIGYVYDFPVELLKVSRKKLVQRQRFFEIENA